MRQEWSLEDVRQSGRSISLNALCDEAAQLVGVLEVFNAVDKSSGEVGEVDTLEAVDCTGVATNLAVTWVGGALLGGRDNNIGEGPWVLLGALVPVLWDALVAKSLLIES